MTKADNRFRDGPTIQHRTRQRRIDEHVSHLPPKNNMSEFWQEMGRRFDCDMCGAKAGSKCISKDPISKGAEMDQVHLPRWKAAKAKYGRKK